MRVGKGIMLDLDHGGIAEVLTGGDMAAAVFGAAHRVGQAAQADASVQAHGVEVRVGTYTTDRAAAGVTLAHPAGLGIQAKHGTLTRAASSAGLEIGRGS